jgi:S1-C subfamily serine protease
MVAAEDQSYADLVNSILPTVVSISVKGTGPSSIQSSEGKNVAYAPHIIDVVGAGTITDASGLIVTNKHVIANAPIRARNGITTALPAM